MKRKEKKFKSILPGAGIGVEVVDGDIAFALSQFRKQVKESGIVKEIYNRRQFTKPSVERRTTMLKAAYRNKKNQSKGL